MWKSNINPTFRSKFSEDIFNQKYRHSPGCETWAELARTLVEDVCNTSPITSLKKSERDQLVQFIIDLKFIPGGRYLYYAGRPKKYFNNCFLLKSEEDTREDWAELSRKAELCLSTGGGIGNDYSIYRPRGRILHGTGGEASGPINKMYMVNEIGRQIMQGGSRRSAIYASLSWKHEDINQFLHVKDWDKLKIAGTDKTFADVKYQDFNFPCPLDMTNISVNYDTEWLLGYWRTSEVGTVFRENVTQALSTAEPGFSFNFFSREKETLRNAPVAGGTWILTRSGYQQVNDIIDIPTEIWTGKQYSIGTFTKTYELSPTIKVLMTGGRTIVCDPNHEFFVKKYNRKGKRRIVSIIKCSAFNLNIGDCLEVSLPVNNPSEFLSTDYTLGYAFGDGSFRKTGGGEITFCTEESKKCFEFTDKLLYSSVNRKDARGFIRAYLATHKVPRGLNKAVCPVNISSSFIAGLFDADGSYDIAQHRIRLASIHYSFLVGIRRELEQHGILSTIIKGGRSSYGNKDGWLLCVLASYNNRFIETIPCKRLKPEPYTPYRTSEIKVIAKDFGKLEDVFCCDIGTPEHSFMAEGVIISNCTEVTSEDDSDVCNLGSVNIGRIETIQEFGDVINLGTKFLVCGTLIADLPYDKVSQVRTKNRRLGLGLMGLHEWSIKRNFPYEVNDELKKWLTVYEDVSDATARSFSNKLSISIPIACRAIAPTGSIGILAGTTTGIEPLYAVAYKRRYLKGTTWKYQYVVDSVAQEMIDVYSADPDKLDSAIGLSRDYRRRIAFQADIQDYVDMAISSTINIPSRGDGWNIPSNDVEFANCLASFAHRLRGFTVYPDGARGGQPLTPVPYKEAKEKLGEVFEESIETHDVCSLTQHGGSCGI